MQSSRKLLENEATSQPEFSPTIEIHLPLQPSSLPRGKKSKSRAERGAHPQHAQHPTYPSFPKFPRKNVLNTIANLVSARVPDTLEVAVPLGEAVHAVVALAHCAHEAAKRVDLVLAGVAAVLVDLGDADLDGAVVLGLDDAVGRAALAGDVPAQRKNNGLVKGYVLFFPSQFLLVDSGGLGGCWCWGVGRGLSWESLGVFRGVAYRSTSSPRSFSILTVLVGVEKGLEGVGGREGADLSSPCLPVSSSKSRSSL